MPCPAMQAASTHINEQHKLCCMLKVICINLKLAQFEQWHLKCTIKYAHGRGQGFPTFSIALPPDIGTSNERQKHD